MKRTKFGILVNKTTYLFPSIRDNNTSRDCGKNLDIRREGCKLWEPMSENPDRREVIKVNPFCGVVWIFSGTRNCGLV